MSGRWQSDSGTSDLRRKTRNSLCLARGETGPCFLSPFFASPRPGYSRFSPRSLPLSPPPTPYVLPVAIKSDLTSIYLRIYPVSAAASPGRNLLSSFFSSRVYRRGHLARMNFVYKVPITFFSLLTVPDNEATVEIIDIVRACWK